MDILETERFADWLKRLRDRQTRARILVRISRLANGNAGDVKSVGNGISELRLTYGPGYRIYYFQRNEEFIILLAGGDKSTQQKDIAAAKEIAKEILEQQE